MNVKLLAHTQLSDEFLSSLEVDLTFDIITRKVSPGALVALTAIRTCYSPGLPSEVANLEGEKYFGSEATDGEGGTEADRLFRHITRSGHTSTLEHLNYTFAIEGVSRSLLAQITRHRHFSFSVQSQRYVKFGSSDKSGGFDYVTPPSVTDRERADAVKIYDDALEIVQKAYDMLRSVGVPAEDARFVLPNGAATNFVMTANLRSLLDFYSKRNTKTHAQWEIASLAESIRQAVIQADPWTEKYFGEVC